ncbi:octaprenyl diphosphate synthase [compost metagenome]
MLEVVRQTGALAYARDVAEREAGAAQRALERLPVSKHRDSLLELASFSVVRQS